MSSLARCDGRNTLERVILALARLPHDIPRGPFECQPRVAPSTPRPTGPCDSGSPTRVSYCFLHDFRTFSTVILGPDIKTSSPCSVPTNFPHPERNVHFDISPIFKSASITPASNSRCHVLAAWHVPYKHRLSLPHFCAHVLASY